MMTKEPLSLSQQESGRRNYARFSLINGLSYICVGETVIILFAIKLGCSDYTVAILGSLFFFSNFCMPLGKMLMAKLGAVKTVSNCWRMRNISILLVAAAPLFLWGGFPQAIPFVMIAGAFAFYACRSIGMIGCQPVLGEITGAENRGRFTSQSNRYFYLSNLIMLAVIMGIMYFSKDIWVYMSIIITGSVFGLISAWYFSRIDETENIMISARQPILADIILTLKNSMRMRQLAANCAISAGITLTVPISMLALKRGYGIGDDQALFFALVQMGGAVASSYVIELLAEHTGPRPLAILFYSMMIVLCGFWTFAPHSFHWYYAAALFICAGAAVIGTGVTLTHYFLISVPEKERVAASLTMYVISGIFAGLMGSLVGASIIRHLNTLGLAPLDVFKMYFMVIFLVLLVGLIFVARLKPIADWKVGEVLGLTFAPRDIMVLFSLYSIKTTASPDEEQENVDRLLELKSGLSEKILRTYLDSPRFLVRSRALNALGEIPFGPETEKLILRELEEGEYTTASMAAKIAGDRKIRSAIPMLRKYIHSDDFYLQGKVIFSLAAMKDEVSYSEIKKIFKETSNPRLVTHGAAALAAIGDDESFHILLEKTSSPMPPKVLYEILYSMAELTGQGDQVYNFLKLYCSDRHNALVSLAEADALHEDRIGREMILSMQEPSLEAEKKLAAELLGFYSKYYFVRAQYVAWYLRTVPVKETPPELLLCLIILKGSFEIRPQVQD